MRTFWKLVTGAVLVSAGAWGAAVNLPGGALTVVGTNASGTAFTYTGTLTQADTLTFSVSGQPCLQPGPLYCTNAAGVLRVAASGGTPAIGGSSNFGGGGVIPGGTYAFGSLIMVISGVGAVQLLPVSVANGSGSGNPPTAFTIPSTSLSTLGFPNFSQVNPTITFIVGDTGFADNNGQFSLTQDPPAAPTGIPISNSGLIGITLALCSLGFYQMRRTSSAS